MFLDTELYQIIERATRLSESEAWLYVINHAILEEIIRLNTEDQLEEQGVDSNGDDIGQYTVLSKLIKQEKGQRYDHITLKDTGDFYASITAKVDAFGIEMNGDPIKGDTNLFIEYGEDILGLTEENIGFIIDEIAEGYIEYVIREMGID